MIAKYQTFLDRLFKMMGADMNRADLHLMDEFSEISPFQATSLLSEWLRNKRDGMHERIMRAANVELRVMGYPQLSGNAFIYGSMTRPLSPTWFTPKVGDVGLKYWSEYVIINTDWLGDRAYIRLPSGKAVYNWLITTQKLGNRFCEQHDLVLL